MKVVFTIIHGQASVKRGFNHDCTLVSVDMKDESIIACGIIKDHYAVKRSLTTQYYYKN